MRILRKKVLASFFLFGLFFMVFYVAIVSADIRIPCIGLSKVLPFDLCLNPPDSENGIALPMNFYLSEQSYLSKLHEETSDYFVEADLFYNGTLTVGKPVFVIAHGYLESPEAQELVHEVHVAFRLSHAYQHQIFKANLTTIDVAIKLHRLGTNELRGNTIMIYWDTPGDFQLIVATFWTDNSTPLVQSSDLPVIHVEPESEIVTERVNRINLGLTIALTYFAFVEGISTVIDFMKERGKSDEPNTRKNEHKPNQYSEKYHDSGNS